MEGIIKGVQSYLENDRLVFLYTPLGDVTVIAKGSQKLTSDLRILSQYLNLISFKETPNKSMYILKEAKLLNSFEKIKMSYNDLELANIMLMLIKKYVTPHDEHKKIFQLLKDALTDFKRENVLSFAFKLLRLLGYHVNLKPDGRNIKGFNLRESRLVYLGENTQIDLNLEESLILLKLSYMTYDKIDRIEDINFLKLKSFMYDYYEYHMDERMNRR